MHTCKKKKKGKESTENPFSSYSFSADETEKRLRCAV